MKYGVICVIGAALLVSCSVSNVSASKVSNSEKPKSQDQVVKTCKATVPKFDSNESEKMIFNIYEKKALISYGGADAGSTLEESVTVDSFTVRPGLSGESDGQNLGESAIIHALAITTDPIMEGRFSAGFDLSKVRTVTVYKMGEDAENPIGATLIVEAFDSDKKALGSFLGGFLVAPCE